MRGLRCVASVLPFSSSLTLLSLSNWNKNTPLVSTPFPNPKPQSLPQQNRNANAFLRSFTTTTISYSSPWTTARSRLRFFTVIKQGWSRLWIETHLYLILGWDNQRKSLSAFTGTYPTRTSFPTTRPHRPNGRTYTRIQQPSRVRGVCSRDLDSRLKLKPSWILGVDIDVDVGVIKKRGTRCKAENSMEERCGARRGWWKNGSATIGLFWRHCRRKGLWKVLEKLPGHGKSFNQEGHSLYRALDLWAGLFLFLVPSLVLKRTRNAEGFEE